MAAAPQLSEVRTWPAVVSVEDAGRALGIGRSLAYRMAHENRLPARVLKFDRSIRVVTSSLLEVLEGKPDGDAPASPPAA